jgi:FkbM family methyltransferase
MPQPSDTLTAMPSPAKVLRNGLRRTRRWVNQTLGRDVRVPVQTSCQRVFLGSEYGGWCICPRGLNDQSVVYSFGVGQDITWDLAMIQRYGMVIHAFDPTPKSMQWIAQQTLPTQFKFHPLGIAARDGVARFTLPRADHVSYSIQHDAPGAAQPVDVVDAPVRSLRTLMTMLGHSRIDVLKMDIEGAEYEVIENLVAGEFAIDQILVEFHHTVGVASEVERTRKAIAQLNRAGYRLFFNSVVGLEYSFIRSAD